MKQREEKKQVKVVSWTGVRGVVIFSHEKQSSSYAQSICLKHEVSPFSKSRRKKATMEERVITTKMSHVKKLFSQTI